MRMQPSSVLLKRRRFPTNITLPAQLRDKARLFVEENRMTFSEYVERLIEHDLEKYRVPHRRAA